MDFSNLKAYLTKVAANPMAMPDEQQQAQELLGMLNPDQAIANHQHNDIQDGDVNRGLMTSGNKPKEVPDKILSKAMPELSQPTPDQQLATFGKVSCLQALKKKCKSQGLKKMSAFIRDIQVKDFPKDVQKEIFRFVKPNGNIYVVQYGMVVSELLEKVDPKNWESAQKNIKDYTDKDEFYKQAKHKYILLMNDMIIDGHHFLAKAKKLGITNSLNVIDLTPARFQKTSMLKALKEKLH